MLISVITNCYNSTATLERTYESLVKQTVQNLEWVLVDDCSLDNGKTKELILRLAKIAPFNVQYRFLEENHYGAKSTYTACTIAKGDYSCILDHDDELKPTAIDDAISYIDKYKNNADFVGVCGRCVDEKGNLIGSIFPFNEKLSTESEIRFKYKNTSELLQFTKTDVLKEVFSKMKRGYTNGFCWLNICQTYKYLYVNDVFRIYDTAILSSHSNTKKINTTTVEGQLETLKFLINSQTQFFKYNYKHSLNLLYQMLVYAHYSEESTFVHVKKIKFPYNFLMILAYPIVRSRFKKYK
jgi:glycosyltransferase involved in cell wall biosynthesis